MRRTLSTMFVFAGLATLSSAQSTQTMRANIRGGGGDGGKCTIEVDVDGAADIEVRGDSGRMRTLQGQPSVWRRFDCTAPLPSNPVDFRFRGVDGRGNVQLLRDPNSAGGAAVVRIEDRESGREGYTFDLEWRGGTGAYGSYGNNGYGSDGYGHRGANGRPQSNDRYNNPERYNNGRRGRNDYGANDVDAAVGVCENAVRDRARREGVRNPNIRPRNVQDNPGNRDRVIGVLEGNRGELYDFSCTMNLNNGNVRDVQLRRR
jgi:hypothetical protein